MMCWYKTGNAVDADVVLLLIPSRATRWFYIYTKRAPALCPRTPSYMPLIPRPPAHPAPLIQTRRKKPLETTRYPGGRAGGRRRGCDHARRRSEPTSASMCDTIGAPVPTKKTRPHPTHTRTVTRSHVVPRPRLACDSPIRLLPSSRHPSRRSTLRHRLLTLFLKLKRGKVTRHFSVPRAPLRLPLCFLVLPAPDVRRNRSSAARHAHPPPTRRDGFQGVSGFTEGTSPLVRRRRSDASSPGRLTCSRQKAVRLTESGRGPTSTEHTHARHVACYGPPTPFLVPPHSLLSWLPSSGAGSAPLIMTLSF